MADVFLFYASEDNSKAGLLVDVLNQQGWSVSLNRYTYAAEKYFDEDLVKAYLDNQCIVFAWSNAANRTEIAEKIIEKNFDRIKSKLLPIVLDNTSLPHILSETKAVDLSDWNGGEDSKAFINLKYAIERFVKPSVAPKQKIISNHDNKREKIKSSLSNHYKFIFTLTLLLLSMALLWQYSPAFFKHQTEALTSDHQQVCQSLPGQGPEMVVIPAGEFQMGEPGMQHKVSIKKPFAIGRCEVTFADYQLFASATNSELPSDHGWGRGQHPVINVSWQDATAYAQWLSKVTGRHYRLPSEAEWEYAARAGTSTDFYWGDKDANDYAWFRDNATNQTHPVGEKLANSFGLYDMSGNVWEWGQDCYASDYSQAPTDGSALETKSCNARVLRGGAWYFIQDYLRSAFRFRFYPDLRNDYAGFRLAQDLP